MFISPIDFAGRVDWIEQAWEQLTGQCGQEGCCSALSCPKRIMSPGSFASQQTTGRRFCRASPTRDVVPRGAVAAQHRPAALSVHLGARGTQASGMQAHSAHRAPRGSTCRNAAAAPHPEVHNNFYDLALVTSRTKKYGTRI